VNYIPSAPWTRVATRRSWTGGQLSVDGVSLFRFARPIRLGYVQMCALHDAPRNLAGEIMSGTDLSRVRRVTAFAASAFALGASCLAIAQPRPPQVCLETPTGCAAPITTGGAGPNPLYGLLDMGSVPFHVADGAYGPRLPFQTAAQPVTTRNVTATTLNELQAALSIPGTRVTIAANILGGNVALQSATDVEIVVPFGRLLRGVTFGTYGVTVWNRVRFIKAPADTIGGQIHQFFLTGATANDLIVDGLQISGGDGVDPAIYPALTVGLNRAAFLRNRIVAANSAFGYGGTHILVAGNSVVHDANNTNDSGDWGFRSNARGPHIYVNNDIRGSRYAKIRFHPATGSGPYYVFAADNTLVDRVENRSIDINDTGSSTGYPDVDGAWILGNRIYVNGTLFMLLSRNNGAATARYVRINGNAVFGASTGIGTGGAANGEAAGNEYAAAPGADPPWGAAGDPTGIDWTP
jgi:hypothetical protein